MEGPKISNFEKITYLLQKGHRNEHVCGDNHRCSFVAASIRGVLVNYYSYAASDH